MHVHSIYNSSLFNNLNKNNPDNLWMKAETNPLPDDERDYILLLDEKGAKHIEHGKGKDYQDRNVVSWMLKYGSGNKSIE